MEDLPKRKQIRLNEYDYSQNGYYFITICTNNRKPLFWDPVWMETSACNYSNGNSAAGVDIICPQLSEYGKIADMAINAISMHYHNISVDKYIIMPDHIHLILIIMSDNNQNDCISPQKGHKVSAPTVMNIIGQMKRWVSKEIGFSVWQKSFYEHIIRNEQDYMEKAEYIINNPLKWIIEH